MQALNFSLRNSAAYFDVFKHRLVFEIAYVVYSLLTGFTILLFRLDNRVSFVEFVLHLKVVRGFLYVIDRKSTV